MADLSDTFRGGNIALRMTAAARRVPDQPAAIVCDARGRGRREISFADLEQLTNRLAAGLVAQGVLPGERLVLMVRPGIEFLSLVFAVFRAGAVVVLIDPGMGLRRVIDCLESVDPDGFVAIPTVQWARWLHRRRFPRARHNVTVGGLLPARLTYRGLSRTDASEFSPPLVEATDPAAILFTSGSTGPAKGVEYEHGMFAAQADLLQEFFGIVEGERDLPGFPLFALFNTAMGVTSVFAAIDPTRPAKVAPERIVDAIQNQQVTQAFGSPALWDRVGGYCRQHGLTLPSLTRVLSAGAPVPPGVVAAIRDALVDPASDIHTPYGATEALPVAAISGREILEETTALSEQGRGTCVGRLFEGIEAKIIAIAERPLEDIDAAEVLPDGDIGEILVRGPSVTRGYFRNDQATAAAKIVEGDTFWHRMGDVGYFDPQGRLWFCGRMAHRVETEVGTLFSVPCEAIFNSHSDVVRSALVGLGPRPHQQPVLVVEHGPAVDGDEARADLELELLARSAAHPLTKPIATVLFHPDLPVDIRHNVKIDREALAEWASRQRPDLLSGGDRDE